MATDTIWHLSVTLRDNRGFIGKVFYHVAGDSSVSTNLADMTSVAEAFVSAVEGLSNAANQSAGFPETRPTLAYGSSSQYPAEWQKAVMTFTNDDTQITRFKIPAPKVGIMDADGVTVKNDGSVAAVVAFIDAVKNATNSAFVSNVVGLPYTHFTGGVVKFGKMPKRFNGFIKSASLEQGEP